MTIDGIMKLLRLVLCCLLVAACERGDSLRRIEELQKDSQAPAPN